MLHHKRRRLTRPPQRPRRTRRPRAKKACILGKEDVTFASLYSSAQTHSVDGRAHPTRRAPTPRLMSLPTAPVTRDFTALSGQGWVTHQSHVRSARLATIAQAKIHTNHAQSGPCECTLRLLKHAQMEWYVIRQVRTIRLSARLVSTAQTHPLRR